MYSQKKKEEEGLGYIVEVRSQIIVLDYNILLPLKSNTYTTLRKH